MMSVILCSNSLIERCCMFSMCCLRNSLLHGPTCLKGFYITSHTSHQRVDSYRTFHRSLSLLCTVTVPVKNPAQQCQDSECHWNKVFYALVHAGNLAVFLCQLNPLSTDEDIIFFLLPVQRQQSAFVPISFC